MVAPLKVVLPVPLCWPLVQVDVPDTVSEPAPASAPPVKFSAPMLDAAAKDSVPALTVNEPVPMKLLMVKLLRTSVLKPPRMASSPTPGSRPPVQLATTSQKLPGPMKVRGAAFRLPAHRANVTATATGVRGRTPERWRREDMTNSLCGC